MSNKSDGGFGNEYLFVRFTKTLPIIKYSENPTYYRHREVAENREWRILSELANADRSSPNSNGYESNRTVVDMAASSISGSMNLENLTSFETIPLQLNVPKQDRSALYPNEYGMDADELNDMTPIMTETNSDIVTPVMSPNFSEDESTTPIYGETRLRALKIYLEKKLHEIERTSSADIKSYSSCSYTLISSTSSSASRKKEIKKQCRKRKKLKKGKQRSSRSCTPVILRKKAKIIPTHEAPLFRDKQTNRKWEPSHAEQTKSSTKSVQDCENEAPQPICRIENVNFENQNFELPTYQSLGKQSTTRDSLDQSDQLCFSHQATDAHMSQFEYSTPGLYSESYCFESPPQPEQRFSNFNSEMCQSDSADMERKPFVLKGNLLEIVPNTQSVVASPRTYLTLLNDVSSKLDESICDLKMKIERIEQSESKKDEIKLKRKQEHKKKKLERFVRKEKLRSEIDAMNKLCTRIPGAMKVILNRDIIDRKKNDTSSSKNENVSFSVCTASGHKSSLEEEEDATTIEKLDTTRRRAKKKATIIRKKTVDEILPSIDPENLPPPPPPDGDPPPHLLQPKLKFVPELIYFHYNPESNTVKPSIHCTPTHIPKALSGKTFSAKQSPPRVTNLINSSPARSLPPLKSWPEIHRVPKSLLRRSPQSFAMISRNYSLSYQVNALTPDTQKQHLPQIWKSDVCFPQYANLSYFINVPPQRPSHMPCKQQQLPSLLDLFVSRPDSS